MNFKMDHIVINVVDINNSLHFYTKILNLSGERIEEFKNNQVPFPSVRLTKDTIIDLFPQYFLNCKAFVVGRSSVELSSKQT